MVQLSLDIKTILNTVPIPLALIRIDGQIVYYNTYFQEFWNLSDSRKEINIFSFIPQEDYKGSLQSIFFKTINKVRLMHYFLTGCKSSFEKEYYSEWDIKNITLDNEDHCLLWPAQTRNNHKIFRRRSRLADLGALSATIAHELRNPLGVIQLATLNIRRKRISPSIDVHIENIEKKIKESNSIISNMLTFSKLPAPNFQKVNLVLLLNEAVQTYADQFRKSSISLSENFHKLEGLIIEADQFQLKEIFINILHNAYQAVEHNQGEIRITAFIKANKNVIITFTDNGIGISPQNLKKVFKPFFSSKARGIGLGLTICKEFIDRHKGKIKVFSKKNMGTRVKISLPLVKE